MSDWKTYKLGDFAELRKEQIVPNGKEQPYIGLEHIEQQSLRLNGVGSSNSVISNKFKFYSGDILYGKLRPYFRKVYKPKFDGVCSTDIYVVKNKKLVDKDYLFYLVATEEFTNIANSGSSGTRMPRADWKQLEKSEWQLPDTATQTQIAQILTSLDDKIELNLQMNQTLEAMAQAMFKEWFVNFNFPNFDGELDNGLPKGWRMGRLSDLCIKITKGTTPTTLKKQFTSDGVNFIKVESINEVYGFIPEKFAFIDDETNELLKRSKIEENDILFTIAGTLGRIAIADKSILPANTNQAVAIIRCSSTDYINYVLFLLKSDLFLSTITSKAVHAVQANISLGVISDTEIVIPTIETLIEFNNAIKPLMKKMIENNYQIQTITQTRDTLLPKLMSGKIKTKD